MSFRRAFFTVGGLTMLSRLTGFMRDMLAANYMGAGMVADAFFIALRLPNLFRRLFAEGAFTISFVPMFTGELKQGHAQGKRFAEEALALLVSALIPFTLVMMLCMPWIMQVITPGFEGEKMELAITLSIITFPYLLLISLSALLGSVLNGMGRFAPYAAAPVAFNLMQILALLFGLQYFETPAHALAWAVSASGAVQLLWLAFSARNANMSLALIRPRLDDKMRHFLKLIGPGALGAGVMQINIFIDMVLASLLPTGSVSYLSYADRLYQLPVGVIGIAIGTALLPMLSRTVHSGDSNKALAEQNRAIEFGLYLGVPAAVALALVSEPIMAVLFERGEFTAAISHATALALAAYAISIPAYMVNKVLTTAFYAREDTKTPFRISLLTVGINTLFSIVVIQTMLHTGYQESAYIALALATALTAWLNMGLLGLTLHRRGHLQLDGKLYRTVGRILTCALGMAGLLLALSELLWGWFRSTQWLELVALGLLVGGGGLLYLLLGHLTGAQRLDEVLSKLKRKGGPPMATPPVE